MARIEFAGGVLDDVDRILAHLAQFEGSDGGSRIEEIIAAINILEHSPLIGRLAASGKRELVIGKASRGYLALYRYVEEIDTVFVLALRSQRESGYRQS